MTPARPAPASIAADTYRQLRDKILSHEVKPGDRLIEDEICTQLSAGRTPVREALLRLQGEGLVSRHRGWMVGNGAPLAFRSIFEGRMAIEGYATRLAAERATPADLAELRQLLRQMKEAESVSRVEVNRLNKIFHQRLVALADNPYFVEQHERTQFEYWSLRLPVIFAQEQLAHSAEQHAAIVDSLERHDGDLAEKLACEHICSTMHIVADALGER